LAEFEWEGLPERHSLRRAIRHRLRRFDPTIRVVAEGFLAEGTPIDLLAVGGEGELVSIRIGTQDDDALLFTEALADLTWLRPRAEDFLKLAPGLGLEPSAEPRAMLFCPHFAAHTLAAAENFPTRSIELLSYRCLRQQGQLSVLIESWNPSASSAETRRDELVHNGRPGATESAGSPRQRASRRPVPMTDAPSGSSFRTGLTEADLRSDDDGDQEIKILD